MQSLAVVGHEPRLDYTGQEVPKADPTLKLSNFKAPGHPQHQKKKKNKNKTTGQFYETWESPIAFYELGIFL